MENILSEQVQFALVIASALIFGSFSSLLTSRIGTESPIVFARSCCPNCKKALGVFNLIPIFSWLFQRGKCSNCKTKISWRYPLIELSFLLSFLIIYFLKDQKITPVVLLYFAITSTMISMCVVDLERYFIPDVFQYFLAILAAIFIIYNRSTSAVLPAVGSGLVYMVFGLVLWAFFYFTAKIEAIGIDDIKFFFIAGFLLGFSSFVTFTFLSGIFGLIFGGIWQKIKHDSMFPFGPPICLASLFCLVSEGGINLVEIVGILLFS